MPLSPVTLEGYGLYLVTLPDRATDGTIQTFCDWMRRMFPALAQLEAQQTRAARSKRLHAMADCRR